MVILNFGILVCGSFSNKAGMGEKDTWLFRNFRCTFVDIVYITSGLIQANTQRVIISIFGNINEPGKC